jgi:hypothetical protein
LPPVGLFPQSFSKISIPCGRPLRSIGSIIIHHHEPRFITFNNH